MTTFEIGSIFWVICGALNAGVFMWVRYLFRTAHGSNFRGIRQRVVEDFTADPLLLTMMVDRTFGALVCGMLFAIGPVAIVWYLLP